MTGVAVDKYVPWHDVQQEKGFVKEVIEEQINTLYWNGETYTNSAVKFTTTVAITTTIIIIMKSNK